jgi:hypothetical protein
MSKDWSRGFSAGVLAALYVIHHAGQDTYYDEIMDSCNPDDVIAEAKRSGNLRGSGIKEYKVRKRDRARYVR